jgi:hypothetical protein
MPMGLWSLGDAHAHPSPPLVSVQVLNLHKEITVLQDLLQLIRLYSHHCQKQWSGVFIIIYQAMLIEH